MILGIAITLVVLFFLSVLRLFVSRFVRRDFSQVVPFLQSDNPEILGDLFDPATERQLSDCLNRRQLRREQLNRIRLGQEYVARRTHNVVVWQEWADTELRKSRATLDAHVRTAAEELVAGCAEYRIASSSIQAQLRIWQLKLLLLPLAKAPSLARLRRIDEFDLLQSYERIKQGALKLADLCGGNYSEQLRGALQTEASWQLVR
jgi:hypothetical protein